ncbi:MAG: TadE family protein [Anaerolineales bacterium]
MRKFLQKLFSFSTQTESRLQKRNHKSRGQSLVEMAITLPVLLMLFSGMVELGFMLNFYLSLQDATRYAAREYSNGDPFNADPDTARNSPNWFYIDAASTVYGQLAPISNDNDTSVKTQLNGATDDVIITVYSVEGSTVVTIPTTFNCSSKDSSYHLYCHEASAVTAATITHSTAGLSGSIPCQGILVVEVYEEYHQVLGLPWMAPMGSPLMHAETIMPLPAVEPGEPNVPLTGLTCT